MYANGNTYDGELDNYLPHGYGQIYDGEILISNGKFNNNQKVGLFIKYENNEYRLKDYGFNNNKVEDLYKAEVLNICHDNSDNKNNCYGKTQIVFNPYNLRGKLIISRK